MSWPGPDRWRQLWQDAQAGGDPAVAEEMYATLTRAYAEPGRHYHNQQHIAECLEEFDAARHLARQPIAVELAVWFHDAVYDPKAGDNEEQSATLAQRCLETAGLAELGATVSRLVLATKTHCPEPDSDAALLVDVDLSILGQSEERFAAYENAIREEYHFVPGLIFRIKRAEILERFLARPRLYHTEHFASRYEEQARRNLAASIRQLKRIGG